MGEVYYQIIETGERIFNGNIHGLHAWYTSALFPITFHKGVFNSRCYSFDDVIQEFNSTHLELKSIYEIRINNDNFNH